MPAFEPKIAYARELENNRFILVVKMWSPQLQKVTYLGGIAVIANISGRFPPGQSTIVLIMDLQINWLQYEEVDLDTFIIEDLQQKQNTLDTGVKTGRITYQGDKLPNIEEVEPQVNKSGIEWDFSENVNPQLKCRSCGHKLLPGRKPKSKNCPECKSDDLVIMVS